MRLSHSSVTMYLECRYKWFLNYMLKLRATEEKSALKIGDAVDEGLNYLLETRDLPTAIRKFKEKWEKVAKAGNIIYSKSDVEEHLLEGIEIKKDSDRGYYSWLKKGEILITEYHEQIMPLIKEVVKVQINESMHNDQGDELVIKTDFIAVWHDGRRILFDNKTSSVKYDQNSVKESNQLAIYYDALKEEYNLDACGYIVIPKKVNKQKKPLVKIEVIIDNIPQNTIDKTHENFNNTLMGVKLAQFDKNHQACMGIYGKCQYYSYCHEGKTTGLKEVNYEKK